MSLSIDELNKIVDKQMQLFYQRLKQLRIESKSTQVTVSKAANISDRAYRNLESGISIPKMDTVILLAKYFNVSVDYLTGSSDDPLPKKIN